MIYCLIANNKIVCIDSSPAKINDKICSIKKDNPKTVFFTKSYCDTDFKNTFEGSIEVLRNYINKCLILRSDKNEM